MSSRVRWGILGTATIARQAVIPAMRSQRCAPCLQLVALASRDLARAESLCRQFEIERAHGSYDDLLADESIDAVYIPLPNHLHVPYAIAALEAGKHVLCEKPLALSASEAESLLEAGRRHPHLKWMEAFMYRLHPQWEWVRRAVSEGRLGTLRSIHSCFTFFDDSPSSILHHAEWGGGALMDIGCYCVSLSRWLFGSEPWRVLGRMEIDPRFGVDRSTSGMLEFSGGTATLTCATQAAEYQRVELLGTRGRLELQWPFNPPADRPTLAWLEVDGTRQEISFEPCDPYAVQLERFSRAILDETPVPIPVEDSLANLRAIDALVRSTQSQQWEGL